MTQIRKEPCSACPYRRDVASGVWAEHEYDKLLDYDRPTGEQPIAAFSCHATPDHYCHGWAVVHSNRGNENDLLALRLRGSPEIPEAAVPLFNSGQEAAEHGKADIENPSAEAHATVVKLQRKHERLR
jgi:Family of unknown function (DUF6283)